MQGHLSILVSSDTYEMVLYFPVEDWRVTKGGCCSCPFLLPGLCRRPSKEKYTAWVARDDVKQLGSFSEIRDLIAFLALLLSSWHFRLELDIKSRQGGKANMMLLGFRFTSWPVWNRSKKIRR